jgi:hypothetical protein
MSFSQIRDYINGEIITFDNSLEEWRDAVNIENIPSTDIDNTYHIGFDVSSGSAQDSFIEDSVTISVNFWKKGYNEPTDALDSLMDTVCQIRNRIVSHKNMEIYNRANNSTNMLEAQTSSITPAEISASNDNTIQVTLELNTRIFSDVDQ